MQGVCVMGVSQGHSAAGDFGAQLVCPVDADVAAVVAVVGVGEEPAQSLGEPPGHGDGQLAADLIRVLGELLVSPDQRHRLGVAGRQRALEVYSWESVAAQTARVYERAIARNDETC